MQDLIAILIAAVAAAYLMHRTWQRVMHGQRGKCGSCANRGPSQSVDARPLVTVDKLIASTAVTDGRARDRQRFTTEDTEITEAWK